MNAQALILPLLVSFVHCFTTPGFAHFAHFVLAHMALLGLPHCVTETLRLTQWHTLVHWTTPYAFLTRGRWSCRQVSQCLLALLGALHGVNHRGKVHQEGIAHGLDDVAVTLSHCLLDNMVVDGQQPQHTGFIGAHLTAEAHDVGEHNGGQSSSLSVYYAAGVIIHVRIILPGLPNCQPATGSDGEVVPSRKIKPVEAVRVVRRKSSDGSFESIQGSLFSQGNMLYKLLPE